MDLEKMRVGETHHRIDRGFEEEMPKDHRNHGEDSF